MNITYLNATLPDAERGIRIYNHGLYGYVKNPDLDERARQMFSGGLGSTTQDILSQVEFIGKDYGGAAGFKAAYSLAPDITRDIFETRAIYVQTIQSAKPILLGVPGRESIKILYAPFVKHIHGKSNWLVWANKFWHHLKPDTFPIEDRFVDGFFKITDSPSVDKYMKFLEKFRPFVLARREWIPAMRLVDANVDSVPCSENKLWDKMFYGLGDEAKSGYCAAGSGHRK